MVPLTFRRYLPPIIAALLLAACGAPEPASRDRFFALEPTAAVTPGRRAEGGTLLVNDLAARGFLGGRQIVYRTAEEPLEVKRYPLLLWEEPPGRALARELTAALREARRFELVITPAQRARSDYLLGGEVTRFEHLPTDHPAARAGAELNLTLLRGDDRRSLIIAEALCGGRAHHREHPGGHGAGLRPAERPVGRRGGARHPRPAAMSRRPASSAPAPDLQARCPRARSSPEK